MKKIIMFVMFLFLFPLSVANAAVVKVNKDITLDFTMNYKSQVSGSEHIMKNVLHIAGDKWHVAGRFQTSKNDKLLLFLVKMLSHRNSKFTFQFMIIDADNKNVFITEPRFTLMAGLPSQQVIRGNGRTITLNTLLNITGGQP